MIFWEFPFFPSFFLYVDSLFSEMNVVSFFPRKKTLSMEWMLFFSAQSCKWNFFYHCTSTDFFHILQISYEIKKNVYSHAYLTICFIELACYGSRDNVFEQIIWIWNWRKCRLNLRYMILTSAALNPLSCFCFPFCIFSCSVPPFLPRHHGLCLFPFVLKLAVSLLDYFILFRLLNSLFYVTPGKTSDRCLFCFSG